MGSYKHYINPKQPGQMCFVTATCLDFAHLFAREEMRTRMCLSLLRDCQRWEARLYGYVVMSHHIHLVICPNNLQTISTLMKQIKDHASGRLFNLLDQGELNQLSMQDGLGRNHFWKRSFRANPLFSEEVFRQKLEYLHQNPVRANLVRQPEDYVWSSMHVYAKEMMLESESVDLVKASSFYRELLNI